MDPKNAGKTPQQRVKMPPFCRVGLEAATSVYFDFKSIHNLTCGNQGFSRENQNQHSSSWPREPCAFLCQIEVDFIQLNTRLNQTNHLCWHECVFPPREHWNNSPARKKKEQTVLTLKPGMVLTATDISFF